MEWIGFVVAFYVVWCGVVAFSCGVLVHTSRVPSPSMRLASFVLLGVVSVIGVVGGVVVLLYIRSVWVAATVVVNVVGFLAACGILASVRKERELYEALVARKVSGAGGK